MFYQEIIHHPNPKLQQLVIRNDQLKFHTVIFPNLGASIQAYETNGIAVLEGISFDSAGLDDYNVKFQSSLLFPFFGRIPEGKYSHDNKTYTLDCNGDQGTTAIHGHVYDQPFKLIDSQCSADRAQLDFSYKHYVDTNGFPFPYEIRLRYSFCKESLQIFVKIKNTGTDIFPFGLGWHPYFKTNNLKDCSLSFQADSQLKLNDRLVPEGITHVAFPIPLEIGNRNLDHGFLLGTSKFSFTTQSYRADLGFSSEPPYSYMQVYTPPNRKSVAIEPLTCAPNCFNNGLGLQLLEPGFTYGWEVHMKISIL